MVIDLVLNNSSREKNYSVGFFKKIIKTALTVLLPAAEHVGLSINLVNRRKIQALNKKFLQLDCSTDVLSFSLSNKLEIKKSNHDIMELGDIFICPSVARRRDYPFLSEASDKNNGCFAGTLAWLTLHGLLHLLGYHHDNPRQQARSFNLQKKILKKIYS